MEPPTFKVSAPEQLPPGRFKVEIIVSDVPGMANRRFGATPKEADKRARQFMELRLDKHHKSKAAVHARAAGRAKQAHKVATGAPTGGEA